MIITVLRRLGSGPSGPSALRIEVSDGKVEAHHSLDIEIVAGEPDNGNNGEDPIDDGVSILLLAAIIIVTIAVVLIVIFMRKRST
jgi:hypothetical protein